MVYSIRKNESGDVIRTYSHSSHRGDVIARSDDNGSLTWYAIYEAYGTRPETYELGANPDRQMANTKDEEAEIGLLNEGMRYRDLETGVFLTRDPIGYGDGPNVYCYVHCNPITSFDPLGLAGYGFEGTGCDPNENGSFVTAMQIAYEKSGNRMHVSHGVGTRTKKLTGALGGNGAKDRIDRMMKLFEAEYKGGKGDTDIDIFGFSRGAAMAREFANRIAVKHKHAKIRFLGLFDTVAQIGLADPINNNPGIRLDIPNNVQFTAHAVARNEYRGAFPLSSIVKERQWYNRARGYKEVKGSDFWEKPFDGVHSEVGGGYRDDKGNNRVNLDAFGWMISTANHRGVPVELGGAVDAVIAHNYTHSPNTHDSRYPFVDRLPFIHFGRKFRRVFHGNK